MLPGEPRRTAPEMGAAFAPKGLANGGGAATRPGPARTSAVVATDYGYGHVRARARTNHFVSSNSPTAMASLDEQVQLASQLTNLLLAALVQLNDMTTWLGFKSLKHWAIAMRSDRVCLLRNSNKKRQKQWAHTHKHTHSTNGRR